MAWYPGANCGPRGAIKVAAGIVLLQGSCRGATGTLRVALGGSEARTGQHREARIFGEACVGETELAEKEDGVAGGSNLARVHASVAQAGVF
jgi:hypothetical protein